MVEHLVRNQVVAGSIPVSSTNIGELAQSGERALHRGEVRGSNPLFSTMLKVRGLETSFLLFYML